MTTISDQTALRTHRGGSAGSGAQERSDSTLTCGADSTAPPSGVAGGSVARAAGVTYWRYFWYIVLQTIWKAGQNPVDQVTEISSAQKPLPGGRIELTSTPLHRIVTRLITLSPPGHRILPVVGRSFNPPNIKRGIG
jgi:hypothetical protein